MVRTLCRGWYSSSIQYAIPFSLIAPSVILLRRLLLQISIDIRLRFHAYPSPPLNTILGYITNNCHESLVKISCYALSGSTSTSSYIMISLLNSSVLFQLLLHGHIIPRSCGFFQSFLRAYHLSYTSSICICETK
jgi:hypothetical protein